MAVGTPTGLAQCTMTESQVSEAFLAAPPLIAQQIMDLSIRNPIWLRDIWQLEEFPRGNGTVIEQIVFRGQRPQIERGFSKWKKLENNAGCEPCDGPDCSYNWTDFGGHGLERKLTQLMSRDFKSPSYCIKEIQTTAHFREVFAKVVENLYAQVDFFKELNIGQNVLSSLAKKYVVDSAGAKPNPGNPYVYRNIGDARISMLNIEMLESFYEYMRRIPDCIPYDVVNGAPLFSMIASQQTLARLYRDDPQLRQDVRFSGMANDLLTKYNFMSTVRGMFICAPVLYPRRFTINGSGDPVEVLPFINDVPMEIGSFTGFNPLYEAATHEEVILHGKWPFKLFFLPTETTLGANTSFGPEFSFMNSWIWVNPMTMEDPARRLGYFFTGATIGISQQFSDGIFGILVERPSASIMASWLTINNCPPVDPTCDNEVPAALCPCPLILSYIQNPVTPDDYFINLAVPVDVVADDTIQFGIDTGGYVTGTVVAVSSDGKSVEVTFSGDLGISCDRFTTIFCDDTLGCTATIDAYSVNCLDNTRLDVTLSNPIKAVTNGDSVTLYYGDGTSATVTVISADMVNNTWVLDVGGTPFCDQLGGLVSICVPTATDASCGACGGPTFTQCET